MVKEVKAMGLETCLTAGMLGEGQAERLRDAGLDYYNHNLDAAPEFYGQIITTRTYQDRLDTLGRVRDAGLKVCSGGIVGMGETRRWPMWIRWTRLNSSAPLPWPASPYPAPWCACLRRASKCQSPCSPCAFWPAPIPCSMATSCSPPATRNPQAEADRALLERLGMRCAREADLTPQMQASVQVQAKEPVAAAASEAVSSAAVH